MFCRNCGKELKENSKICTECGTQTCDNLQKKSQDIGGFGWSVLGFFFPIVGLILYLVWKDEKPVTAKAAGVGALIGFILGIVFSLITSIIYMSVWASYIPYI